MRAKGPETGKDTPSLLPPGLRVIAIGDIHGQVDLYDRMIAAIAADRAARPVTRAAIVVLGDVIDRGPASAEVIDRLLTPPAIAEEWIVLSGNHEQAMLDALADDQMADYWWEFGGAATARSYGVFAAGPWPDATVMAELREAIPADHIAFIRSRPLMHREGGYTFVHAGIRPGIPLDRQTPEDLVWIRAPFLDHPEPFDAVIVHGHTPVADVEVRHNRINVDIGAFATHRLAAVILEGDSVHSLVVGPHPDTPPLLRQHR